MLAAAKLCLFALLLLGRPKPKQLPLCASVVLGCVMADLLAPVLAAVGPARRAARRDIADALRQAV